MAFSVLIPSSNERKNIMDGAANSAKRIGANIDRFLDDNGGKSVSGGSLSDDDRLVMKSVNTKEGVVGVANYLMRAFIRNARIGPKGVKIKGFDKNFVWPSKEIEIPKGVSMSASAGRLSSIDEDDLRMQVGMIEAECRYMQRILRIATDSINADAAGWSSSSSREDAKLGLEEMQKTLNEFKKTMNDGKTVSDKELDSFIEMCEKHSNNFDLALAKDQNDDENRVSLSVGIRGAVERAIATTHVFVKEAILNELIDSVSDMLKSVEDIPVNYEKSYGADERTSVRIMTDRLKKFSEDLNDGIQRIGKNTDVTASVLDLFSKTLPKDVSEIETELQKVVNLGSFVEARIKRFEQQSKDIDERIQLVADGGTKKNLVDEKAKIDAKIERLGQLKSGLEEFNAVFDRIRLGVKDLIPDKLLAGRVENVIDSVLSGLGRARGGWGKEKFSGEISGTIAKLERLKSKLSSSSAFNDDDLLDMYKRIADIVNWGKKKTLRMSNASDISDRREIKRWNDAVFELDSCNRKLGAILGRNQLSVYGDNESEKANQDKVDENGRRLTQDFEKVNIPMSVIRTVIDEVEKDGGKLNEYKGKSLADWLVYKNIPGYTRVPAHKDPVTGEEIPEKIVSQYPNPLQIPKSLIESHGLKNDLILFYILRKYRERSTNLPAEIAHQEETNKKLIARGKSPYPDIDPDPINHVKVDLTRKELKGFLRWLNDHQIDFNIKDIDPNLIDKVQKDAWKATDAPSISPDDSSVGAGDILRDDKILLNGDTVQRVVGLMTGRAIDWAKKNVADKIVFMYNNRINENGG